MSTDSPTLKSAIARSWDLRNGSEQPGCFLSNDGHLLELKDACQKVVRRLGYKLAKFEGAVHYNIAIYHA